MTTLMRVLVLGAKGFIGSAVARGLAHHGSQVEGLGRGTPPASIPGVTFIRGSIEDGGLLRDAIARCTHIVYAASVTTPGTSARDPALEVSGNLLPLARVLECASEFDRRHIVYLSSGGTVYGDRAGGASEDAPLRPRSYYGAGKVAAEALLHACAASTGWSATVLRPTNLYGPGQPTARGFAIIPTLFERALDGGHFQIWGDGSAVRDYCYIDDLVEAIVASLLHAPRDDFAVYNVASGCAVSVLELAAACERACRRPIAIEFQPPRGVDVQHVSPLADAMAGATGWRARVDLEEGLANTWNWLCDLRKSRGSTTLSDGT